MRTERVRFFSEGVRLSGFLHRPDADAAGKLPFIVQGPGWLGLADAKLYGPYHEAFTKAGFAVLIFDYRGFGESEGDRGTLSPQWQLEDWRNAIAYMRSRDDMDAARAAVFGSGGTGGGNAVLVAGFEPEVRATISQVPVADGRDWLHRMRQEHEWVAFLASVDADRRARAATGSGTVVHPREGIMVAYRPLDVAGRVRGLMVIGVADDAVTPTDHAEALYEAAQRPKRLVLQRNTTHYAAYKQYAGEVIPMMVEWLRALVLRDDDIEVREAKAQEESVRHIGGPNA